MPSIHSGGLGTPKRRVLFNTISKMSMDVISCGEPTYWPSDRHTTPDLIDSNELLSDHTPIIITLYNPQEIIQPTDCLTLTTKTTNRLK